MRLLLMMLFLFSLVMSVLTLTFNGRLVLDDEHLFGSATRSLAVLGKLDAGQVYGNARLKGDYHGVEPGHPVLAALPYRLAVNLGISGMQAAFYLNVIYTALTAVMVCVLVIQFGGTWWVGSICALSYAFATLAWYYGRTFFREPLAALLITSAWLCLELAFDKARSFRLRRTAAVLSGLFCVGMLLTKVMMVVAVVGFLVAVLMRITPREIRWYKLLTWMGILLLVGCVYLAATLTFEDSNSFYRFSGAFLKAAWERLHLLPRGWGTLGAFLGILFSPGKGFFTHTPVFLLALLAPGLRQKQSAQWLLPWGIFLGLVTVQVLAYNQDWWTVTWSTRFLLPAAPLLIVAIAPVIEKVAQNKSIQQRMLIGLLIGVSFIMQIGSILVSVTTVNNHYLQQVTAAFSSDDMWRIAYFPPVLHWQEVLKGAQPDLLLARLLESTPLLGAMILGWLLILITISVWGLWHPANKSGSSRLLAAGGLVAVGWALLIFPFFRIAQNDPVTYSRHQELDAACVHLDQHSDNEDILLVSNYLSPMWTYLMYHECVPLPWYGLPLQTDPAWQGVTAIPDLLSAFEPLPQRIWLVSEYPLTPYPDRSGTTVFGPAYSLIDSVVYADPNGGGQVQVDLYAQDAATQPETAVPEPPGVTP